MIDPDLAQQIADLHAEVSGLRILGGLGALGCGICAALAMLLWSRQRSMHAVLLELNKRSSAQVDDIAAAGMWAREEMARRRLRIDARRTRRCGTES